MVFNFKNLGKRGQSLPLNVIVIAIIVIIVLVVIVVLFTSKTAGNSKTLDDTKNAICDNSQGLFNGYSEVHACDTTKNPQDANLKILGTQCCGTPKP